ncbi:hypothetical protein Q8W71_25015 [Methylobacterium sp. NEAU 140]|uniref:hypothetical protein n=1 Tax=Methylobacterium sp. NEAU 140 TaxID=3064945 RepID=UPI002734CCB3|nr:hypothetical protein [Methylobacterium sp. NEAU 140]MDP4025897.1 hypothetical protein [Methylobacterium sp. NEAU 140]
MTDPTARRPRAALAAACLLAALAGAPLAPAPLAAQEGASAVQDVTLTDVTLPLGSTLLRAPKLTASGTRLSREDLAAILKADSAEPWPARLARLDAGSLVMPVLTSEHAGPGGARQTVTYRDVVARDVRAGRIGELGAAGATVSIAGGPGKGNGTYGRIRATDLDLAALSRLYAESGDGKGPVQRVYGALQVADVTYSDAGGTTVKIGRIEGRDLGGRSIAGGWGRAVDALTGGLDKQADRTALLAAADLVEGSSLGSIEMQGLSVSDADPAGPLLAEIGRIAYAESGPTAGLTFEDLSLSRGAVRGRLGRLALTGLSLEPTAAGLRGLAIAPEGAVSEDDLRRLAPALGGLTLANLSVDLPPEPAPKEARPAAPPRPQKPGDRPAEPRAGDPLTVPVTAAPPRVALRDATLAFGPTRDGVPSSGRLALSGLSLPTAVVAGQPLLGALPAYGYQDLDLDLAVDAAWDAGARDVTVREIALTGRDIGSVRLSGVIGGIGPELFSGSVPAATMVMFSGSAKALDLTVENAGLFERFLAAQAKDMSLKPDELRKEYVTASLLGVPVILGNTSAAKGIGAALGQFVMKPGRVALHAKSKDAAGIGFIDLGAARSPAAILDRLDIEAKAN